MFRTLVGLGGLGFFGIGADGAFTVNKNIFMVDAMFSFATQDTMYAHKSCSLLYGRVLVDDKKILLSALTGVGFARIDRVDILSNNPIVSSDDELNIPLAVEVLFKSKIRLWPGVSFWANWSPSYSVNGCALFTLHYITYL